MKRNIFTFILLTIIVLSASVISEIRWGSTNTPLDGLTITWKSTENSDKIRWGYSTDFEKGDFSPAYIKTGNNYLCNFEFKNVIPDTVIFYEIYDTKFHSVSASFETAPASGKPYSFIAMGDSRSYVEDWKKISELALFHKAIAVIFSGDIVSNGGEEEDWDEWFFTVEN